MTSNTSLEDLLMVETSRRNTDLVAGIILQDPGLFAELMQIYLRNEDPVSRRAVWVADTVAERMPELLVPYLDTIVDRLPAFTHDGMKRVSLRMLVRSPLPESSIGTLINLCFDWLISPKEAVAQKMYSMQILYRIAQIEPDLRKELADSIEWRMDEETPGFRSQGKKILRKINKELRDLQNT